MTSRKENEFENVHVKIKRKDSNISRVCEI